MAYTPINSQVFLAAYAGAIASMATSGWNTDPVPADYSNVAKIAGAFAKSIDTLWNDAGALDELQSREFQSVSQGQFSRFASSPLSEAGLQVVANWNIAAAAVIAIINQSETYLATQGIVPAVGQGEGILRINEVYSSAGAMAVTNTPAVFGGAPFKVGLDRPNPDLYYGFEVVVQDYSTSAVDTRELTVEINGSYNSFVSEFNLARVNFAIPVDPYEGQALARYTLTKGSLLPTPVAAQTRLEARIAVYSGDSTGELFVAADGIPGGAWLRMIEAGANG